ncbi:MAG: sulfite exporter TauE/SafE family protein [Thermodesulfobacteriota bacterium]|nr:sulfite exporter TauE/SafE family protein [Thermodesulfobacteriota bacterium]
MIDITILAFLVLYLAVGAVVGLTAGFFGGGAGIITTTILIYAFTFLGYSDKTLVHTAVGTSLFVITLSASSGSIIHLRRGIIYIKHLLSMAICGVLGAFAGGMLSAQATGGLVKKLFAFIVILVAIRLYRGKKIADGKTYNRGKGIKTKDSLRSIYLSGICGFFSGLASAFFGIGGGIIMVPSALFILKFTALEAVSLSTCLMAITALIGCLVQVYNGLGKSDLLPYSIGYVNYTAGLAIAFSGIIVTRWAAKKVRHIRHKNLTKVFAVVMAIAAVGLLLK